MEERQLWKACEDGKVEEVQKLLQNEHININRLDPKHSMTPFFRACGYGHFDIVKLLLSDERVDINKPQGEGATPFFIACEKGHIGIVKLLLSDERTDINKATNGGATPFYIACQNGRIDIVNLLLSEKKIDTNKTRDGGFTPFYIACQEGHTEIAKRLLINKRIDIKKPTNDGATPFFMICSQGQIEIVKYLLACGREIDINKKWNNTKTPLDISKERSTSTQKFSNETDEQFQKAKKNCSKIVELIESFQRNPVDTREKLRKELGLPDHEEEIRKEAEQKLEGEKRKLEEERKKIEEEKQKLEEKRKETESKKSTYEIEHNGKLYKLKTAAKTLPELADDIKLKIKLQENDELVLEFKENGNLFVLDEIEDLEEGMRIKVTTPSTQPQQKTPEISNMKISPSNPSVFLTHTWVKDELNRDNHARVAAVNKLLQTWFDEDKMVEHIYQKMAQGIDDSDIILVFITKAYMEKLNTEGHDNCKKEFTYAITRKKKMIPIVMEPCMRDQEHWIGTLGVNLAGDLYVNMSESNSENDVIALVERVKKTWS